MDFTSWTTLVTEHLVIGLQGMTIILLFSLRFQGLTLQQASEWIRAFGGLSSIVAVIFVLAFAYSLGILLDRTWDLIVTPLLRQRVRRIWQEAQATSKSQGIGRHFYRAEGSLMGTNGIREQVFRRRGRIRILRALLFHIPLLAVAVLLHHFEWWIVIIAVVLEIMNVLAFIQVHRQYISKIAFHHAEQSVG